MIPDVLDKDGRHSLRVLIRLGIERLTDEGKFKLLHDKDRLVVAVAAQMLASRPEYAERAFASSVELSEGKSSFQREIAASLVKAVAEFNQEYRDRSIPILLKFSKDPVSGVRSEAVVGLGHLKVKEYKSIVLESLNDDSEEVIESAVFSLWSLGLTNDDRALLQKASERCGQKTRESINDYLDDLRKWDWMIPPKPDC
jgi:HEAT repeat protein